VTRLTVAAVIGRIIQSHRHLITLPLRELALQTPNQTFFSLVCSPFCWRETSKDFVLPSFGLFSLELRDAGFDCFESHEDHQTLDHRVRGDGRKGSAPTKHPQEAREDLDTVRQRTQLVQSDIYLKPKGGFAHL
jgi:hypothetical protein